MWVLLLACTQPGDCESLCDKLVYDCDYEAFPSMTSCLDGCAYKEKNGSDIAGELDCVEKSSCDTFAVVECENRFGATEL